MTIGLPPSLAQGRGFANYGDLHEGVEIHAVDSFHEGAARGYLPASLAGCCARLPACQAPS
jgi:hypothetical protein